MARIRGGSWRAVGVASVLAWLLLITPAAGAERPPDQVDPPAPGEGQPLDDPSDPPPPQYTATAQPSPSVRLTGPTWPKPRVARRRAHSAYAAAVDASRSAWPNGAARVVLTSAGAPYSAIPSASLAGAANAPLLLTKRDSLPPTVAREIVRLEARRVFVVGAASSAVITRLKRMGVTVERINGANRYQTSMMTATRAIDFGATRRTVIVVSGTAWADSAGVSAYAAGLGVPVLLTNRSGKSALAQRVSALGARRVLVVGRKSTIPDAVVSGLPNVTRVGGRSADARTATLATHGRNAGLTGRPVITSGKTWTEAATHGVAAGRRRRAVVLTSSSPGLSPVVAGWLKRVRPSAVTTVEGARRLPVVTRCQIASGRFRSWRCAERTLKAQGYVVPRADGKLDRFSVWAIYAFEKVARLRPNGHFGNEEWNRMLRNPRLKVRRPDLPAKHVEINIGKQLILLVRNGRVAHHIHTSTGKASTPTIRGTFTVYEKRPYRQSHNEMYYPIFFHGGYAMHGYPSIPLYPASHGCARVYDGNMDFIYPRVAIGDRVATY